MVEGFKSWKRFYFAYFAPQRALREKNRRDVFIIPWVKDKIMEVNG